MGTRDREPSRFLQCLLEDDEDYVGFASSNHPAAEKVADILPELIACNSRF